MQISLEEQSAGQKETLGGRHGSCIGCAHCSLWDSLLRAFAESLQATKSTQLEQGDDEQDHCLLFNCSGGCVLVYRVRRGRSTLKIYRSLGGIKRCDVGQKEDRDMCESKHF